MKILEKDGKGYWKSASPLVKQRQKQRMAAKRAASTKKKP